MSWEVGDMAVCVLQGMIDTGCCAHSGKNAPSVGRIGKVVAIMAYPDCACLYLVLESGEEGFFERFRKVVRDKYEPCETEFVTLLKRAKRPVTA